MWVRWLRISVFSRLIPITGLNGTNIYNYKAYNTTSQSSAAVAAATPAAAAAAPTAAAAAAGDYDTWWLGDPYSPDAPQWHKWVRNIHIYTYRDPLI